LNSAWHWVARPARARRRCRFQRARYRAKSGPRGSTQRLSVTPRARRCGRLSRRLSGERREHARDYMRRVRPAIATPSELRSSRVSADPGLPDSGDRTSSRSARTLPVRLPVLPVLAKQRRHGCQTSERRRRRFVLPAPSGGMGVSTACAIRAESTPARDRSVFHVHDTQRRRRRRAIDSSGLG
jgi:hypothetical protein